MVGLIAERLLNRALPYEWLGAIAAGLLGAWLMTDELHIIIAPRVSVIGIPLISAILGAMIVVFLFSLIMGAADSATGVRAGDHGSGLAGAVRL